MRVLHSWEPGPMEPEAWIAWSTAGSSAQVKQGRRSQVAVKCPAILSHPRGLWFGVGPSCHSESRAPETRHCDFLFLHSRYPTTSQFPPASSIDRPVTHRPRCLPSTSTNTPYLRSWASSKKRPTPPCSTFRPSIHPTER